MDAIIRMATSDDTHRIADIYNHYILNTVVTFEEVAVQPVEMAARITAIETLGLPWLVAEVDGTVMGYAYATGWKNRQAYRHSVEIAAYVDRRVTGLGIGTALYIELFTALRELPIHSVVACLALPNLASVMLHERFGMIKTAHFTEVGYKFNMWIDIGYWQINLPVD